MSFVTAVAPVDTDEDYAAGLRVAQAYLHSLGITAWQDAIVGIDDSYRTLDTYARAAADGELTARVVGALWWDRTRGLEQIERFVDARARATVGRFAPTSVKIMQDGIIENFTAATLTPYLDANGAADGQRRHLVRRSRAAEGRGDAAGRARVPGAFPRAGRPRGSRGPGCDRGRPDRERPERQPPPSGAHPDRASRRHPAVPPAGRRRERPALVGGARGADGPPDDPVHRPRAGVVAVPVRQPGARRRRAGVRQRLERLEPEPAAGDDDRRRTPRAQPRRSRSSGKRSARSSSPRSGSTWPPRSGRSRWAPPT